MKCVKGTGPEELDILVDDIGLLSVQSYVPAPQVFI